jgi:hypothetical protein
MHSLFVAVPALLLALPTLLLTTPALAAQLSFDEIPAANANCCYVGEQYAALGVHFVATDDGSVWQGLSQGDPGGWGLEGTHGPAFLGFNGKSYSVRARFDEPVTGFGVDVSASAGARAGSQFRIEGFRAGALVESFTLPLGGANQWSSVALGAEVDEVRLTGVGTGFHPFGLDNLRWSSEPPLLAVEVDLLPGSAHNPVRPGRPGVVPVVLFGSEALDVGSVDAATLALGGAAVAHRGCPHVEDVDADGFPDLVSHHRVPETGLLPGDTELCLTGETVDGQPFEGCDAVTTLPAPGAARRGR